MKIVGSSSLWTEKYRPQCIADYIGPSEVISIVEHVIETREVPNLLLYSRAPGSGKTSLANVIAKELGSDLLYINASVDNSIDTVRYNVQQFAMTSSLVGGKKLVVLDEFDRMTAGQDALKVIIEQVEENARFVLCTNNLRKVIDPVISRCQVIDFDTLAEKNSQNLMLQQFKRAQFVLDNEGVAYDKAVLAELVKKTFPDMRMLLNELQKFSKIHGKIDSSIFGCLSDSKTLDLVAKMKSKKFNEIREAVSNVDAAGFYSEFYAQVSELLQPECIPEVIIILGRYGYQHGLCTDVEVNLAACICEIMAAVKWR